MNTDLQTPIAIAGAGLVGRLLAWRLLSLGYPVHLFDQDSFSHPTSAAHTAAAMISPMSEVVVSERSIFDMGIQSLALWPEWLEQLGAVPPVQYQNQGSIVVAHPNDYSELEQFYQDLRFHLKEDNNARWLNQNELQDLEPDLAGQFENALYLPNEAHLDNRALLNALLDKIKSLGGKCFENSAINFTPCAELNGEKLNEYPWVFDCRGVGSGESQQNIRGVRGEVLWVKTNEVKLARPIRLMHPRYKLYIVPKPNNCFIVGATEIESEDRSPVSVQSMLELCSALYTLNPAFAEARILELDANLRPSYLDNLPKVNDSQLSLDNGQTQRVTSINGLYRHGYLLAPHIIETVLNHIKTDTPILI